MLVGEKVEKPLNLTEGRVRERLDQNTCDMPRRKHHEF